MLFEGQKGRNFTKNTIDKEIFLSNNIKILELYLYETWKNTSSYYFILSRNDKMGEN